MSKIFKRHFLYIDTQTHTDTNTDTHVHTMVQEN